MRRDGDSWGITESVGVTALAVAMGRAVESHRPDGLVHDPYAELFVRAARSSWTTEEQAPAWRRRSTYIGVRSHFFDRFLIDFAADQGGRPAQAVILAAGLDTRALRLDWPPGSTVYEIDQRDVLEFKQGVLPRSPRANAARRIGVAVDLREDWPAALRSAGFDPGLPTAWLAEGLLPYLPAYARSRLLDRVGTLSPAGSRIAVEHFGDDSDATGARVEGLSALIGVNVADLMYLGDPQDPEQRLRRDGWIVRRTSARLHARAHRRSLDAEDSVGTYGEFITGMRV